MYFPSWSGRCPPRFHLFHLPCFCFNHPLCYSLILLSATIIETSGVFHELVWSSPSYYHQGYWIFFVFIFVLKLLWSNKGARTDPRSMLQSSKRYSVSLNVISSDGKAKTRWQMIRWCLWTEMSYMEQLWFWRLKSYSFSPYIAWGDGALSQLGLRWKQGKKTALENVCFKLRCIKA